VRRDGGGDRSFANSAEYRHATTGQPGLLAGWQIHLALALGETRPAEIAPDGTVWVGPAPVTDEEKRALARLMQDARAYSGGETLTVDRSQRGGRGFDVFLRAGGTTHNLSDCGDDVCQQASLASDRRRALFVRMPRF
jgi:hypothetical protein